MPDQTSPLASRLHAVRLTRTDSAIIAARRPSRWRPRPATVPAAESAHPVAPAAPAADTMIFTAPDRTTYYLPRLRLRSSQQAYDVRIQPSADGRWTVRFGVEPFPAPELGDAARSATALTVAITAALQYSTPITRVHTATEVTPDAGGWTVGFAVTLEEKDAILWAMRSDVGAVLELTRSATVAVPVSTGGTKPVPTRWITVLEAGNLAVTDQLVPPEQFVPVEPDKLIPVHPDDDPHPEWITNWTSVPAAVIDLTTAVDTSSAEAAATGEVTTDQLATRIAADRARDITGGTAHFLSSRSFRVAREAAAGEPLGLITDDQVGVAARIVRDHRTAGWLSTSAAERLFAIDPIRGDRPVVVTGPAEPVAAVSYQDLAPVSSIPLRFDPAVHPEIFGGGTGSPQPGFTRHQVRYPDTDAGRVHVYFQDNARPEVFSYLPDEFRLGRTDEPPLRPALAFGIDQGQQSQDATVELTVHLEPFADDARLAAAGQALTAAIPTAPQGQPQPIPVLQPAQAPATLSLALPAGAQLATPQIDLANGFPLSATFPFAAFQSVFAALAATDVVADALRGAVTVQAGGVTPDQVPVSIRFGQTVGPVLTTALAPADQANPSADGALSVTLTNATESPVRITALLITLSRAGSTVGCTVEGPALPTDLTAGASCAATLTPAAALPGDGEIAVDIDPGGVTVLPDAEAILAVTLDSRIDQMSARPLTIITTPAKLAGGGNPVETVVVEIDGIRTDAPVLDAATSKIVTSVPVPLADVLLRRDDGGRYRFRQTVIHTSGETTADTDWRTGSAGVLVVPV